MKKIFKYVLDIIERQEVIMPVRAKILCVQTQREKLCLWALVDPDAILEPRKIRIHGTGHDVPDDERLKYIGTAPMRNGSLIWHVFEE